MPVTELDPAFSTHVRAPETTAIGWLKWYLGPCSTRTKPPVVALNCVTALPVVLVTNTLLPFVVMNWGCSKSNRDPRTIRISVPVVAESSVTRFAPVLATQRWLSQTQSHPGCARPSRDASITRMSRPVEPLNSVNELPTALAIQTYGPLSATASG